VLNFCVILFLTGIKIQNFSWYMCLELNLFPETKYFIGIKALYNKHFGGLVDRNLITSSSGDSLSNRPEASFSRLFLLS
jgi:hypothetical protein